MDRGISARIKRLASQLRISSNYEANMLLTTHKNCKDSINQIKADLRKRFISDASYYPVDNSNIYINIGECKHNGKS